MEVLLPLLMMLPQAGWAMIGLSLGLGVCIAAILFMAGYALSNPQLVAVAREELAALVFTVMILFFWFSCDTIINGVTNGLVVSASSLQVSSGTSTSGLAVGHVNLAMASLKIIESRLVDQYKDLYMYEMLIGFLSTISFPIGSPLPGVGIISLSFSPFVGLTLLSNAHTMVVEAIGYAITVLWAKDFILMFCRDIVPLLFLPLGLVMRAVPFFRRTGSSIIAAAFAMYFVFPFALLLSNYLIFDVYKPVDFAYTPSSASFYDTEKDQATLEGDISDARGDSPGSPTQKLMDQFKSTSLTDNLYKDQSSECASGNPVFRFFCSAGNIIQGVWSGTVAVVTTTFNVLRFMASMTGDFVTNVFTNPAMPASTSAGLYYFIIQEILLVVPFLMLITLLTVIEIILTLTMYRNIALIIGGEAEMIGISKVV